MAENKEIALKQALKIDLKQNHLYHFLLAELYSGIDKQNQLDHLDLALKLTKNENDRILLKKRRNKASGQHQ